jgi:Ca-activated chloride channel family protein
MNSTDTNPNAQVVRKEGSMRHVKALIAAFWWHAAPATALLCAVLLSSPAVLAQQPECPDRTLSPYFFVKSADPSLDQLPLKETSAEVRIAGVIADVTVTQVYRNEGKRALEAVYVFPGSTRAAIYAMAMTIGTRTIDAIVKERTQARAEYEQARAQGRAASLLEQQRPNVFQMNVANIMPGDEIKVKLSYTELLVPTEAVYEFVYPTVVGPRYSNQPTAGAPDTERWVENPYHHQGEVPTYALDIKVTLSAGMPIQKIACASHRTSVSYDGPTVATVTLDPSERQGGNRDFVLRYGLAGSQVESGLLLYQDKGESFFLLMVQPPKRVALEQIPPREYLFIVDVSGSMHGYPLEVSKKLLADLIGHLRPTDTFNVLLFSGGSSVMSERSLPATPENVARAINVIERQQGGGGTELLPALRRALALPRTESVSRTVVIATDGYVAVEKEAFDLIRGSLASSNVFAFGIGTGVNRFLIEGIARAGMGEPFVVAKPEEAAAQAEKFREYVASPVLTQVRLDFGTFEAYDVEPPAVPDVLAERPVIVFGKWRGQASGHMTVRGITGIAPYLETFDVGHVKPVRRNVALRYLWARHRIAVLGDYTKLQRDDERVKEITTLGLTYSLLTDYTSFVAIDTVVRKTDGKVETVTQPLPLPQGVSDFAVGGQVTKMVSAPSFPAMGAPGGVVGGASGGVSGVERIAERGFVPGGEPVVAFTPHDATGPSSSNQCITFEEASRIGGVCWAFEHAALGWRFPATTSVSTIKARLKLVHGSPALVAVTSSGTATRGEAERVVRTHLVETRACLEKAVAPGAELVITLTVRANGTVEHIQMVSNPT